MLMPEPGKRKKDFTRRKFIQLGIKSSAGIGLSQAISVPVLLLPSCKTAAAKITQGACYHDCPDTCSWTVTSEDNKITNFEASQNNPYTAGKLCSKMEMLPQDVTYHPERILTPLKRIGKKGAGDFIPVSWEEALSDVANKLSTIRNENGGEAILPYSFAGTQGLIQKDLMSHRFFSLLGASKLERTICGDAAVTGVMATNGQTTGVLPKDIIHSKYVIIWGTNPVASNQHLWILIKKARERGAKIVSIDPFESETASRSDWHIQPKPGTDTILALGLIHVILAEHLQDEDYISKYTLGIEELTKHTKNFTPGHVAEITGIKAQDIVKLSREYSTASPSIIRVLIGMEHQVNGASAFRAVAMLPALTGAWKNKGGGMMHMTYELFGKALNWEPLAMGNSLEKEETRTINMIRIGRALSDEDMNPKIRALIVYNSNPAVIAPNQNLVIKGLEREDLFTVVLEHFITDTARYADYVFPATTQLEHWDLHTSWGQTYVNLNQPAISPMGESKPNSEFFRLLAKAMNFSKDYFKETDTELIKKFLQSDHEYLEGISFESLLKTGWAELKLPEPWLPHLEGNFGTSSGKCEFYNPSMNPPLPGYQPLYYSSKELQTYPLHLLTPKSTKNFLNSSHANVAHLLNKEGIPFLDIHEEDASARNISDGADIRVYNQRGEVYLTARIAKKTRRGVCSVPQGFWPSLMKGGSSANALTSDLFTDMGNGAALHESRVEVENVK